jgi:uncharacterized protein (TIGR02453 family)
MAACFTPRTISFLRALKKNNDREWFKARKETYDRDVREPMIAVIERLAQDFQAFAPDLLATPQASLYRIYRDTRFSDDKTPLKTHVAAVFPHRALPKHEGAGLYFHIALDGVWAGGGMYAPQTTQLARVREHVAANHRRLRAIVESPSFKKRVGAIEGEKLQRVPRGFAAEHPAADYLKFKQFLAGKEYPAAFATSPRFYSTIVGLFRDIAPFILFLNEPLIAARRSHASNALGVLQ